MTPEAITMLPANRCGSSCSSRCERRASATVVVVEEYIPPSTAVSISPPRPFSSRCST